MEIAAKSGPRVSRRPVRPTHGLAPGPCAAYVANFGAGQCVLFRWQTAPSTAATARRPAP